MKHSLRSVLTVLFVLASACSALAEDPPSIGVGVPKGDKLTIRTPRGWLNRVVQPTPAMPPSVKITTKNASLSLQITFLPDTQGRFATRESVDRAVTQANQHYIAGSLEKSPTLIQLVSTNGHGCYALFTDADYASVPTPPKGEFRNVASGLFVIKRQVATFTILTNDPKSSEYREALQTISDGISAP